MNGLPSARLLRLRKAFLELKLRKEQPAGEPNWSRWASNKPRRFTAPATYASVDHGSEYRTMAL